MVVTGVRRITRLRGPISLPAYLVLGALTMITPLSTNIVAPALPRIADAFGTTPASAQVTISAALIGIALGQLRSEEHTSELQSH